MSAKLQTRMQVKTEYAIDHLKKCIANLESGKFDLIDWGTNVHPGSPIFVEFGERPKYKPCTFSVFVVIRKKGAPNER